MDDRLEAIANKPHQRVPHRSTIHDSGIQADPWLQSGRRTEDSLLQRDLVRDFRWNSFMCHPVGRTFFPHNHTAELRPCLAKSVESSAQREAFGASTCWISGRELRNSGSDEKTARGNYGNLLKDDSGTARHTKHRETTTQTT